MSRFTHILGRFWQRSDLVSTAHLDLGSFYSKLWLDQTQYRLESSYLEHRNGSLVTAGTQTLDYYDRSLPQLKLVLPFLGGVVGDQDQASLFLEKTLTELLPSGKYGIKIPRSVIKVAVTSRHSPVQKQVLDKVLRKVGAIKVDFENKILAISRSQQANIGQQSPLLVLDIGAETTLVGLCSGQEVVEERLLDLGSFEFNRAIQKQIRTQYQCEVGFKTAEHIKKEIGRVGERGENLQLAVRGKDILSFLPKTITVSTNDFRDAFNDLVNQIVAQILELLVALGFDDIQAVTENGLLITGGGSQIKGLRSFVEDKTKIETRLSRTPYFDVVRGMAYGSQ